MRFADDAAATGTLDDLLAWWKQLSILAPGYGYFVNTFKSWLIVKEDCFEAACTCLKVLPSLSLLRVVLTWVLLWVPLNLNLLFLKRRCPRGRIMSFSFLCNKVSKQH